jgi:hypothetical protein
MHAACPSHAFFFKIANFLTKSCIWFINNNIFKYTILYLIQKHHILLKWKCLLQLNISLLLLLLLLLFMSMGWDLRPWTAATGGSTVQAPDDIWLCTATVEIYWQGKTEPSASLSPTSPTWTDQSTNPDLWECLHLLGLYTRKTLSHNFCAHHQYQISPWCSAVSEFNTQKYTEVHNASYGRSFCAFWENA